jgi:thiamine-phosphate pyrophosphorylase
MSKPGFVYRGLYAITDNNLIGEEQLPEKVEEALIGGAAIIQYRDKTNDSSKRLREASELLELCNQYSALLIINDDVKLAFDTGAHGVHIGKDDEDIQYARNKLGKDSIIGVSCYNSYELATNAQNKGADYIAFGSFFPSSIKPEAVKAEIDLLQKASHELNTPIVAIGGITSSNAPALIEAGADMLAVISDVFGKDDITQAARNLAGLF